jgi:uncharacterized protein YlxW (UPF0749 family)
VSVAPDHVSTDTSDGVLERFLSEMVIDEYADVPVVDGSGRRQPRWAATAVAALIGIIVAVAVVNARVSDDDRQQGRAALTERIASMNGVVAERQARNDEQAARVDALQQSLLDTAGSQAQADSIARLGVQAGTSELTGPGVTVTIDDATDAEAGSLNRVLDRDLQDIVNALWRMGASGIAVNGERLTSVTAIRGAGEAILVNYRPLTRPYQVTAIGTTTTGDEDSGLRRLLSSLTSDYGLVADVTTGDVALPAGELRTPRFAMNASEEAGQ